VWIVLAVLGVVSVAGWWWRRSLLEVGAAITRVDLTDAGRVVGIVGAVGTVLAVVVVLLQLRQSRRSAPVPFTEPSSALPLRVTPVPAAAPVVESALWLAPRRDRFVVDRPELAVRLVGLLTGAGTPMVGVTGVYGAGGFGKTTLVGLVCHRAEVKAAFPGGLVWVTLGEDADEADIAAKALDVCTHLDHGRRPALTNTEQIGQHLGRLLDGRGRLLLVLDDVWRGEQLAPFLCGGTECVRLITTRDVRTLTDDAETVWVDEMAPADAHMLLTQGLPPLPGEVVERLLALTGRWALLLAVVNRRLHTDLRRGADPVGTARLLADRLAEEGPASLSHRSTQQRNRAVHTTLGLSLDLLTDADRQRFLRLGVLAEDTDLPIDMLGLLWGLDVHATRRLCDLLADLSLVQQYRPDLGTIRLHDVIRAYNRHELGASGIAAANDRLIGAARELLPQPHAWWLLPDQQDYLWRHLASHLAACGHATELLHDLRWVEAKLRRFDPLAADADLSHGTDPTTVALRRALQQCAHLLSPIQPEHALSDILISRLHGYPTLRPLVGHYATGLPPATRLTNLWPLPDLPPQSLQRTINTGHSMGQVVAAPDGSWLATTGGGIGDPLVRIWDSTTGRHRHDIHTGHQHGGLLAVAPDGSWIATTGYHGALVRTWDPKTGRHRRDIPTGHQHGVGLLVAASDGSWLATTGGGIGDRLVRICDPATGQHYHDIHTSHQGGIRQLVAAPDGSWLATTGGDTSRGGGPLVQIWDPTTGRHRHDIHTGHQHGIGQLMVASNGSWLATTGANNLDRSGGDPLVRFWDPATGRHHHDIHTGHRDGVRQVAAPDGSWLVTTGREISDGNRLMRIWDPATGRHRHDIHTGHQHGIGQLVAAPDGSWLATTDGRGPLVQIWDPITGRHRHDIHTGALGGIAQLVAASDGSWLATTSGDPFVRIWDPTAGQHHDDIHTRNQDGIDLSVAASDGSWLATTTGGSYIGDDLLVRIWDPTTGQHYHDIHIGHQIRVWQLVAASDGSWLATAGGGPLVRIWDPATGRHCRDIHTGHQDGIGKLVATSDGSWIATTGGGTRGDPLVRIWDPATGQHRHDIDTGQNGIGLLVVAPDGSWIATVLGPLVRIWDPATGQHRRDIHTGHQPGYELLVAAPDGSWLAIADHGGDRLVRIWDPTTGQHRHDINTGHQHDIRHLVAAPDGSWLATSSSGRHGPSDPLVRIWDPATGQHRHDIDTGHQSGIEQLVVAPDSSWLATTAHDTIKIHTVAGQPVAAMRIDGPIRKCVWLPRLDVLCLVGLSNLYGFKIQRAGG
jgi:WD40 repeat protein